MSKMKSVGFRMEREATWRQLESLVLRIETKGLRKLTLQERVALPKLYRATLSALSVARAIALDRNLLEYLESLSARAYCCVYGARGGVLAACREFTLVSFPATIARLPISFALTLVVLLLGAWIGYQRVSIEPEAFYAFVDPGLAAGRDPLTPTSELEHTLELVVDSDQGALSRFAAMLFTHNSNVAMLAFALGALGGIPVLPLIFATGTMLGAFSALFDGRGLGVQFFGWLLPHGVTELLAIVLAGTVGLELGRAVLFPGRLSRRAALERAGKLGGSVMLGVVLMLCLAGAIEGIFRQTVNDTTLRYTVASSSALLWTFYFGFLGPRNLRRVAAR